MNDDRFDDDLRSTLLADAPSEVPDDLRRRVAAIPVTLPAPSARRWPAWRPVALAFAGLATPRGAGDRALADRVVRSPRRRWRPNAVASSVGIGPRRPGGADAFSLATALAAALARPLAHSGVLERGRAGRGAMRGGGPHREHPRVAGCGREPDRRHRGHERVVAAVHGPRHAGARAGRFRPVACCSIRRPPGRAAGRTSSRATHRSRSRPAGTSRRRSAPRTTAGLRPRRRSRSRSRCRAGVASSRSPRRRRLG